MKVTDAQYRALLRGRWHVGKGKPMPQRKGKAPIAYALDDDLVMQPVKKAKRTAAQKELWNLKAHRYEDMLADQLTKAGHPFIREYVFHPTRKWRFDFIVAMMVCDEDHPRIAVEVDGGVGNRSRHFNREGLAKDLEKRNEAMLAGWDVLHVMPKQVRDGTALKLIRRALGWVEPPK